MDDRKDAVLDLANGDFARFAIVEPVVWLGQMQRVVKNQRRSIERNVMLLPICSGLLVIPFEFAHRPYTAMP